MSFHWLEVFMAPKCDVFVDVKKQPSLCAMPIKQTGSYLALKMSERWICCVCLHSAAVMSI